MAAGHLLRRRDRRAAAHPHLADAGARDGGAAAADLHRRPGPRLPPRLRRHPHADVPPGRGARGRRGHHARRPQGHAARVRAGDLRRRARDAPAPALLPVHRAERRGRRLLLPLRRHRARCPTARAARSARAIGWIEILGAGMVDPNVFGFVARATATTPSGSRASPSGWGSSGSRCSSTASPTCACSSRTTCASWSSSDEGPAQLAARVLRPRPRRRGARRARWR